MTAAPESRESQPADSPAATPPAATPPAATPPATGRRAARIWVGLTTWLRAPTPPLRAGERGLLSVIIGLMSTWVIFQALNQNFLTTGNLSNLVLQITAVGIMAIGITLVLLLGEVDLSIGSVSGLAAAILAVLTIRHGVPEVLALILVVLVGLGIGALHGAVWTRIGVPSFVVTLAGLIGWQGLHLYLLSPQGTINISDHSIIVALTREYLPAVAGWLLAAVMIGCYLAATIVDARRRSVAGLPRSALRHRAVRLVLLSAGVGLVVGVLNSGRGVPIALGLLVVFAAGFDLMLRRTRFGRSIIAIGGNVEAARRAGIPVNRVRVTVFALGSAMAAIGGILATSRGLAATQSTGGNDVLLFAIAAAVIGGVSLFGGRGSTYGALLGIAVIGTISNGMDLFELDSSVRFMITGTVLLVAVSVDSLSRRHRQLPGRT